MATKNIDIVIKARDEASKELAGVRDNISRVGTSAESTGKSVTGLKNNWVALAAVAAGAGVAANAMVGFIESTVTSANKMQAALTGLNSVARAFGHDANAAEKAARDLAFDGLMTVTDSAKGLKNLLASGFSLDEAVVLMKRFKDSAAFGRQSALSFGDAIASATEGIKNGNSILVDNAGVTKNLSMMLVEAGYSAQDLMKASDDAGVRQAIFNGILQETNAQLGDADRLTQSTAGKQAEMSARTEELKAKIGESLQPAILKLLETLTPMVEKFAKFTEDHPNVVAAVTLIGTAALALIATLGTLGLAVIGLGPIFTAMSGTASLAMGGVTAAVGATKVGVSGLSSFVGSAAATGPWGILAAAGVAAAALLIYKWQETEDVIRRVQAAIQNNNRYIDDTNRKLNELANNGKMALGALYKVQEANGGLQTVAKYTNNGQTTYLPTYASGTNYHQGGMAIVGEEGPELVNLPRGAQVLPADETEKAIGGKNIQMNATFNVFNEVDLEASVRELGWRLSRV